MDLIFEEYKEIEKLKSEMKQKVRENMFNPNYEPEDDEESENSDDDKLTKEKIRIIHAYIPEQTHMYQIEDYLVHFPHEAYPIQIEYMKEVINACKNKNIAALELPTGTGKTLSLLCSTLSFLKEERKRLYEINKLMDDGDKQPVIYYVTRTHVQLSNIIKELNDTVYKPINSIIGNRTLTCPNHSVIFEKEENKERKCEILKKTHCCPYLRSRKTFQKQIFYDVNNVNFQDLKREAYNNLFCPFYFEIDKIKRSDIVFLTYSYIFDPKIRKKVKLNLKNSIIIVDEAHNINDFCCDSYSQHLGSELIFLLIENLKKFKKTRENYFKYLEDNQYMHDKFQNLKITEKNKDKIQKFNIEQIDKEIKILGILKSDITNLKLQKIKKNPEDLDKILNNEEFFELFNKFTINSAEYIKPNKNNPNKIDDKVDNALGYHLKYFTDLIQIMIYLGCNTINLENFVDFLDMVKLLYDQYCVLDVNNVKSNENIINSFIFYCDDKAIYEMDSKVKKSKKTHYVKVYKRVLHILCMNPGYGLKQILDKEPRSIILTSGTLAPFNFLESELKIKINNTLEGTHVIKDHQIFLGIMTDSLNKKYNYYLTKNSLDMYPNMLTELGKDILKILQNTPKGVLCFAPSYPFLIKCKDHWEKNGIYAQIDKVKKIHFDDNSISKEELFNIFEANNNSKKNGAILFSVCRGSFAEGTNFTSKNIKLVIIIGVPLAYFLDPMVFLKEEFLKANNKIYKEFFTANGINPLNYKDWYNSNAIKAVNQSIGRLIRNSKDYGAVLLIDQRYDKSEFKPFISKWIREKAKTYSKSNKFDLISDIKNFFENAEILDIFLS